MFNFKYIMIMKKSLLLSLLCMLFVVNANIYAEEKVYGVYSLSSKAEYPDGWNAVPAFANSNFKYPAGYQAASDTPTRVIAEVIIEKDGSLTLSKLMRPDNAPEWLIKEVQRLLSLMPKCTAPGKVDGEPVRSSYTVPILSVKL